MQEVFERIIDQLKAESVIVDDDAGNRVVEIIEQAAEEFAHDTNVGSNGWIPCSDRLPENDCYCLVTTSDMEIGIREYGYSKGFGWDGFERIIAWQPLPKPYQPKGE